MKKVLMAVAVLGIFFCNSTVFAGKNPAVAMLLSAVAPGAGQFYNGDNVKGAICLTATAVSIGLMNNKKEEPFVMWGQGLLVVNWVFSVFDAGLTAWMRNVKSGGVGMNFEPVKDKGFKVALTYKF